MYGFLLRRLPAILLGAAGVASIAYAAWRKSTPATVTRELTVCSLPEQLRSWIPKLPFLPFIRLEVAGSDDYLLLTGDGDRIRIDLLQATARQRAQGGDFSRICSRHGQRVRDATAADESPALRCSVAAEDPALVTLLEDLLSTLFGAAPDSPLLAAVPSAP